MRYTVGLAAGFGLVGALAWALFGSPLLEIRSVEVLGARELAPDEVVAAADVALDTPLLLLDTGEVRARVSTLSQVADVQVDRTLWGAVRIAITERTAVAVRSAASGWYLIDATGTPYATVPEPPPGLPELRVPSAAPGDPETTAALTVLAGLPSALRAHVVAVAAHSPADVVFWLGDGREVRWGGIDAGARKAAVLVPLLTQPGQIYDVSSPELPTIS